VVWAKRNEFHGNPSRARMIHTCTTQIPKPRASSVCLGNKYSGPKNAAHWARRFSWAVLKPGLYEEVFYGREYAGRKFGFGGQNVGWRAYAQMLRALERLRWLFSPIHPCEEGSLFSTWVVCLGGCRCLDEEVAVLIVGYLCEVCYGELRLGVRGVSYGHCVDSASEADLRCLDPGVEASWLLQFGLRYWQCELCSIAKKVRVKIVSCLVIMWKS
jgi:hypothetical protein